MHFLRSIWKDLHLTDFSTFISTVTNIRYDQRCCYPEDMTGQVWAADCCVTPSVYENILCYTNVSHYWTWGSARLIDVIVTSKPSQDVPFLVSVWKQHKWYLINFKTANNFLDLWLANIHMNIHFVIWLISHQIIHVLEASMFWAR